MDLRVDPGNQIKLAVWRELSGDALGREFRVGSPAGNYTFSQAYRRDNATGVNVQLHARTAGEVSVEQTGTPDAICMHSETGVVTDFIDVARYEALVALLFTPAPDLGIMMKLKKI